MDKRDRTYPKFDAHGKGPWTVCPTCRGTGTHVNPNIDRHGIDPDEYDFEFIDNYQNGVYDVLCAQCDGHRVVPDTDHYKRECESLSETDELWASEIEFCYGSDY